MERFFEKFPLISSLSYVVWDNNPQDVADRLLRAMLPRDVSPDSKHFIQDVQEVFVESLVPRKSEQTATSKIRGEGVYDVFLCHNSQDKRAVKDVGKRLRARGLKPWLDEWELRPGQRWQPALEQQIQSIRSAAVFVGENGIGPWQDMEQAAFLREFVRRPCPVIPVILRGCEKTPLLPIFLSGMTWVDFRKRRPDPLKQLVWGITGYKEQ